MHKGNFTGAIKRRAAASRQTMHLSKKMVYGTVLGMGSLLVCLSAVIAWQSWRIQMIESEALAMWQDEVAQQKFEVAQTYKDMKTKYNAVAHHMAEMQSRLLRLDAMGEHLLVSTGMDNQEFDFDPSPAIGGPVRESLTAACHANSSAASGNLLQQVDELARRIDEREQELSILEDLMSHNDLESNRALSGRPIKKGWLSSRFGIRKDPFRGVRAWHKGLDFAAKEGSEILSVAAGVITWSGRYHGYGNMVEINHGNGYVTRYGHNKDNAVTVGDVVAKGDLIAYVGNTGRSTGPHLHFEVIKNGKHVNPSLYLKK